MASLTNKYSVLSVTTLGSLMAAVDSTIVFLAVPAMARYFRTGVSLLTLVIVMYIVTQTAMMIPSGTIGNRLGMKRIYLLGFGIFSASSLIIALSPDISFAIFFRGVEGIGAGILGTLGFPILLRSFPFEERGKAIGINSVSWSVGALIGPLLGGFLVTYDWRYIFLINVPIGIAGLILGISRIPKDTGDRNVRLRPANFLTFLVFIIFVVMGISLLNYYYLLAGALMFVPFYIAEKRNPLIPPKLLRNRSYYPIVMASGLQGIGFFGTIYVLSVYFQSDLGVSPIIAGILVAGYPVASIIANPLGGSLLDRSGRGSSLLVIGLVLQGIGIMVAAFILPHRYILTVPLFVAGFGGSIYWAVSTTLGVDAAGREFRAMASGTLYTIRNLSLALGISLLPVFLDLFSSSSSSSVLILSSHVNMGTAAEYYLIFIAVASFASLPLFLSRFRTWEAVSSPNT